MAEQNPNQDEIHDLRNEIVGRQLMELTLAPGVRWSMPDPTSTTKFKTTIVDAQEDQFDIFLVRTPIGGKRDYQYTLEVIRNGEAFKSICEGESFTTERSTYIKNLYNQVERIVLDTETNLKKVGDLLMDTSKFMCR